MIAVAALLLLRGCDATDASNPDVHPGMTTSIFTVATSPALQLVLRWLRWVSLAYR